jgi:hypothetical protein
MSRLYARRRHSAYHEAGHAVASLSVSGIAPMIEIYDNGHGHCRLNIAAPCSPIGRVAHYLAGMVAEARLRKISSSLVYDDDGGADRSGAMEQSSAIATDRGTDTDEVFYDGEHYARLIVNHCWRDIEHLALALLERNALTDSAVTAIACNSKSREPYRRYLLARNERAERRKYLKLMYPRVGTGATLQEMAHSFRKWKRAGGTFSRIEAIHGDGAMIPQMLGAPRGGDMLTLGPAEKPVMAQS